jgi:hypothetical protein
LRVQCPKCGSESAHYCKDERDVTLHCLCGFLKVVATKLGSINIEHIDTDEDVTLPRRDSKLFACLAALVGLKEASTGQIADVLNFGRQRKGLQSNSDVASQLTVLRYKGLVRVDMGRKGIVGGSTWEPTTPAIRMLKGVLK